MATAECVCPAPTAWGRVRDIARNLWLSALALFSRFPIALPPVPGFSLRDAASGHPVVVVAGGLIIVVAAYALTRLPRRPERN